MEGEGRLIKLMEKQDILLMFLRDDNPNEPLSVKRVFQEKQSANTSRNMKNKGPNYKKEIRKPLVILRSSRITSLHRLNMILAVEKSVK